MSAAFHGSNVWVVLVTFPHNNPIKPTGYKPLRGFPPSAYRKRSASSPHPAATANNPEMGYPIMGFIIAAWRNHYTPQNMSTFGRF